MRKTLTWTAVLGMLALTACGKVSTAAPKTDEGTEAQTMEQFDVTKSEDEWRKQLTEEQYRVTRQCGTEPAFTGKLWNEKRAGMYYCVGCGEALFDSKTKYDSGTGWPSFYAPAEQENVGSEADRSLGMVRTEVHCSRCGAHLGHVFDDGPKPTGLRYCINSASLRFDPKEGEAAKAESGDDKDK